MLFMVINLLMRVGGPSKWLFAISMLIPFVIITIARSIDNKRVMEEKK